VLISLTLVKIKVKDTLLALVAALEYIREVRIHVNFLVRNENAKKNGIKIHTSTTRIRLWRPQLKWFHHFENPVTVHCVPHLCFIHLGQWWRWALVSLDGVAPSRIVSVSASVNLPLHHEVQKFSGPGKRAVKRLWWRWWCFVHVTKSRRLMTRSSSSSSSFGQGSSLLWTHTLRPFYSRPIALTLGGEEFRLMMYASVCVTVG